MTFYAYRASEEPFGTVGRAFWHDLKTDAGAIRRAARLWPDGFTVYRLIGRNHHAPLTDGASWRLVSDRRLVR